jgi:hypothetical protein
MYYFLPGRKCKDVNLVEGQDKILIQGRNRYPLHDLLRKFGLTGTATSSRCYTEFHYGYDRAKRKPYIDVYEYPLHWVENIKPQVGRPRGKKRHPTAIDIPAATTVLLPSSLLTISSAPLVNADALRGVESSAEALRWVENIKPQVGRPRGKKRQNAAETVMEVGLAAVDTRQLLAKRSSVTPLSVPPSFVAASSLSKASDDMLLNVKLTAEIAETVMEVGLAAVDTRQLLAKRSSVTPLSVPPSSMAAAPVWLTEDDDYLSRLDPSPQTVVSFVNNAVQSGAKLLWECMFVSNN